MKNNLWKRFFRKLYSSSDFCRMTMKKTFLIFNWFVVYNSFRKRNQREIYFFKWKNIKREKFLCKNELFRIQHSNDCSKTLLNWIRFSNYIFQIIKMKKTILRFQFSLTIIWEQNRRSNFSWRKNIKRFHLNVSYESTFRFIKFFSSQVNENSIKCKNRHFDRVNSLSAL